MAKSPIGDRHYAVNEEIFEEFTIAQTRFPKFKLVFKEDSRFMKVLYYVSFMFIWNKSFMTGFTTTIGHTIYLAARLEGIQGLALLKHELQHIEDSDFYGQIPWSFLYLFPQSLAVLAVFAFVSKWFLLALIFLGPWPAPFRVWAEVRGYSETLKVYKRFGLVTGTTWQHLRLAFTGLSYWKMAWRWEPVKAKLEPAILD